MKVVTAKEMQKIDRSAIEELGIPGATLMGYAGKSIADYIVGNLTGVISVAIFCGTGNNGGDGFVIGYFLSNANYNVDIYLAGTAEKVSGTARTYLNVCTNSDISIIEINNKNLYNIDIKKYELIIDAMLGTGFTGEPRDIVRDAIELINASGVKTLSVDLPSGLPSDGEAPQGPVVKADYTITIGLPKISCVTYPGMKYIGKLLLSEIGFPVSLTRSKELKVDLLDRDIVTSRLNLSRDEDTHKGNEGHLLLIGGFDSMEGAIIMTAKAAFETGIGLCTLLTAKNARQIIAGIIPELITRTIDSLDRANNGIGLSKDQHGAIKNGIKDFFNEGRRYDALVIGPGMGRSAASSAVFNAVIDGLPEFGISRVLVDGDGLYHLSEYLKKKKLSKDISLVITPHFYEASRFTEKSVDDIENNRLKSAAELAEITHSATLLKGPSSIISDGVSTLINTTGNSGLATAGSGDVLSGIIGSLLLKDMRPLDAAGVGAYIHGLAADIYLDENKSQVLKATDIIAYIRKAISEIA